MIPPVVRQALLDARAAYEALRLVGADVHLPGYESCVETLEKAIRALDADRHEPPADDVSRLRESGLP